MNTLMQRACTTLILASLFFGLYFLTPIWTISVLFGIACAEILIIEWPQFNLGWLTPIYPVLPFVSLIILNQTNRFLFLTVCCITFLHDTAAYLIGSQFKTSKILPGVSPGKSIGGFLAGTLISCSITAVMIHYYAPEKISPSLCAILILLNITALCGDLFESYLKRRAGLKDSGTLLPGHGGLLDRLDGLLCAAISAHILSLFITF